jgi:hypothetical protein
LALTELAASNKHSVTVKIAPIAIGHNQRDEDRLSANIVCPSPEVLTE